MKICLADLSQEALGRAAEQLSAARRETPPPKSAAGATPACEAIRPQAEHSDDKREGSRLGDRRNAGMGAVAPTRVGDIDNAAAHT
jgi:hypothetical protein